MKVHGYGILNAHRSKQETVVLYNRRDVNVIIMYMKHFYKSNFMLRI